MKKILPLLLVSILCCCQESQDSIYTEIDQKVQYPYSHNSHEIPIDSAINYLINFMDETGETRSFEKKEISSVAKYGFPINSSRSETTETNDTSSLFYVANFKNNQGYAILSADDRIGDIVIALIDEGNLNSSVVTEAIRYADEMRPIVSGYPTTGPGFFTMDDTDDEIFMNPNTVSLYDNEEDDTLVGNFEIENDSTNNEFSNSNRIETDPQTFASYLCIRYINKKISHDNGRVNFTPHPDSPGSGNSSGTYVTMSDWLITANVPSLLSPYKRWHQGSPFNDFYPQKRAYLIFGNKRKAPAGCFPLSIAKIFSYFEYPNSPYKGFNVNWYDLKHNLNSNVGKLSASHLLCDISVGCNSWYFYHGTFTFPNKAISYMRKKGYNNSTSRKYDFESVTSMLLANKPLIIYSIPGINIFNSHCWNIDGYKIKERTVTTTTYDNYHNIVNSEERIETSQMVHCDFGWQGTCNGYYVSGVFKLDDSNIEYDNGSASNKKTNYNHYIHIITYDSPIE